MSELDIWYQRLPLSKEVNPRVLTETVRRRARIGRQHWHTSFRSIPDGMSYKNLLRGYCRLMHEIEPNGGGIIFRGELGSGKTSLASLVLKYCLARHGRALSFRSADMLNRLALFNPPPLPNGAPLSEGLTSVNYLLIDDLEAEDAGRLKRLELIVRQRFDDQFPTLITTNLDRSTLSDIPWLRSLMEHKSFLNIEVSGLNWRKSPPSSPTNRLL